MRMTIDLKNQHFKDYDGTFLKHSMGHSREGQVVQMGHYFADILGKEKQSDPTLANILAFKVYSCEKMEVDETELEFMKEACRKSSLFAPIITAPIIAVLDKAKPVPEKRR
jgi:hypothetical protein